MPSKGGHPDFLYTFAKCGIYVAKFSTVFSAYLTPLEGPMKEMPQCSQVLPSLNRMSPSFARFLSSNQIRHADKCETSGLILQAR